jgi:hypothetical protein
VRTRELACVEGLKVGERKGVVSRYGVVVAMMGREVLWSSLFQLAQTSWAG